jgi:scyllo-inositol 2-dehydrogenase (NADP+)
VSDFQRRLQVGIVGTGWVATERHIPAFKQDSRATISAILGREPGGTAATARRFRIPRSFTSLEEFLAEPLDVVSVCTPPGSHASLVEAAVRAGKHVLVEKPMTLTSGEGRALEALASSAGVVLSPAHNFLFSRSIERASSLLSSGEAGNIHWAMGLLLSSWKRRLPTWFDDLPGGLFFDEAPHFLYLMRYFLGELQVEQAWHTSGGGDLQPRTERTEARLEGARGSGYLTMWFGAPFSEWLFILFCSRAVLILDLFRDILIHLPPEQAHRARDVLKMSLTGTLRLWKGIGSSGIRSTCGRLSYGHNLLIRRFLDAVIDGKKPPTSAQDGWQIVALLEEILRRSQEGI